MTYPNTSTVNFYLKQLNPLVGGTIQGFVKDCQGFYALVIETPDDHIHYLWIYSDDEGNNPGSFMIQDDLSYPLTRVEPDDEEVVIEVNVCDICQNYHATYIKIDLKNQVTTHYCPDCYEEIR